MPPRARTTVVIFDDGIVSIFLIELQENSARNDLTKGQRKAYAAEVGQLLERIVAHGNAENFQKNWLAEFSKQAGILERTMLNWWRSSPTHTGLIQGLWEFQETLRTATHHGQQCTRVYVPNSLILPFVIFDDGSTST